MIAPPAPALAWRWSAALLGLLAAMPAVIVILTAIRRGGLRSPPVYSQGGYRRPRAEAGPRVHRGSWAPAVGACGILGSLLCAMAGFRL